MVWGTKMRREQGILAKVKHWLADTGKQLAVAIFVVMLLRSSIIEPYKIPSGSMIPTLFIGDHIFVNKFAYGFKIPFTEIFLENPIYATQEKLPARGDVIVFRYPKNPSINYIKRVIGLPGDTIQIKDKVLYINGKPIKIVDRRDQNLEDGIENEEDRRVLSLHEEDLMNVHHAVLYNMNSFLGSDYGPVDVPAGNLFVMGDNRDRSSDSRIWGFVPLENIKGKAMFIWLSFMLNLDEGFKFTQHLSRFGTLIR